jgi:threonine dehydrogenase-like Zn-dependent dehydrogenase
MRALTVVPLQANSARVEEIDEPNETDGDVLVETIAVGVCGTDVEIVSGQYGWSPPGQERLVLGHESIGRVISAPSGSGLTAGDLVVGIVRRPDPEPCYACAIGQWDACRNGRYTEHGIKELHGFMRDRYRASADALMKVDASLEHRGVLMEPTTIVAKAWEQTLATGHRSVWEPATAIVIGAGPIGLLAAMIGRQLGFSVTVIDHTDDGPKPQLVHDLGATYHSGSVEDLKDGADVVMECTGVAALIAQAIDKTANGGVTCLTGVSSIGADLSLDLGAIGRSMVLNNSAVVGSVNANRKHYEAAADALAKADPKWLEGLITRRVPLEDFATALVRQPGDVKVVLDLSEKSTPAPK